MPINEVSERLLKELISTTQTMHMLYLSKTRSYHWEKVYHRINSLSNFI